MRGQTSEVVSYIVMVLSRRVFTGMGRPSCVWRDVGKDTQLRDWSDAVFTLFSFSGH